MVNIVRLIGLSSLVAGYIMFTAIFISAYMNDGGISVDINKYNEAGLELIIQIILAPFVLLFISMQVREERKEEQINEQRQKNQVQNKNA